MFDPSLNALAAAMHATSVRQSVLTANLANVNTPGYRRKDVEFSDALQSAVASGDAGRLQRFQPTEAVDDSAAVRADGNSVDLDRENTAIASNDVQNQALTQVFKARIDILQTAIGTR